LNDKINEVVAALNAATTEEGLAIQAEVVNRDDSLVKVELAEREEFPIMIEFGEDQITVIANLWDQNDVKPGMEAEMMNVMLSMNIALPLSAFAKTGKTYQLFGAMSMNTMMANVVEEITALSDNTIAVFDALSEYLNQ
jgi:hypothetical protein